MATTTTQEIPTPHGTLHTTLSLPPSHASRIDPMTPTLLCIHGNSSSSKIFTPILSSPLSHHYPLLTLDLPGHGSSTNSPTPLKSYTQPSYASAIATALAALRPSLPSPRLAILGWSLGGHIAIELIPLLGPSRTLTGIMLVGTPPIPRGVLTPGFRVDSATSPAFRVDSTEPEKDAFAHEVAGGEYKAWMRGDLDRTDPRARAIMYEAMRGGTGLDQREFVETGRSDWVPGEEDDGEKKVVEVEGGRLPVVAVVNGKSEPYIDLEYIRGVRFKTLWRGECVEMEGLGHAPFWERWDLFEGILGAFLEDVSRN